MGDRIDSTGFSLCLLTAHRQKMQSYLFVFFITIFCWNGVSAKAEVPAAVDDEISGDGVPTASQIEIDRQVRKAIADHVQSMMADLSPQARAGYDHLVGSNYLPADFDDSIITELAKQPWKLPFEKESAPERSDSKIEGGDRDEIVAASSLKDNRWQTLRAFGISPRPDSPELPLQYVVTKDQRWVMNCFACHGGSMYGVSYPGGPNTTYSLESLTEQIRRTKLRLKAPLSHMDVGSMFMPLGTSVGTSNAVMFGVALMNFRDADLNVLGLHPPESMVHHDMDAPAWWHFKNKSHIYIDGFAEKDHKGLMQFMLVRQNGPEKFRKWATDFEAVYEFISQVTPPPYPLPIDQVKQKRGELVFNSHCASCHGSYGASKYEYPERNIDLADIGTDSIRFSALTPMNRKHYGDSWFGEYGQQDTIADPSGYTAPPLHGVWASAPYFHNGSVPTLRDVLFPEIRPKVWRRISESFDATSVGFKVERLERLPDNFYSLSNYLRRWYFDCDVIGKSNQGHTYPAKLTVNEREDLLEYLKTL